MTNKTRRDVNFLPMDEGRKRVIGIMASILVAHKLAQQDNARNVPVTICAIGDAVVWAEKILAEIDHRWPTRDQEGKR